jgi:ABC-type transport system involved in multi-copper enzyme maturation permease subunit
VSAPPAGTIHDLGYKRYAGTRRSSGTRWLVVMRNQVATSWKTWWRYKSALGLAVITTFIAGGVMFILSDKVVRDFAGAAATTMADAALPKSIQWYTRAAFLVSLTIGARVVAGDVQSGAFTFYFARSVRPRDYVLGKLAGMVVLMTLINLAGPLVLALSRLGLSQSTDQLLATLHLVPKAIAVGLLGTLVFATVPVAFSALLSNGRYAMALWAAYYLVFGFMVSQLGRASGSWVGALDLATALDAIALQLFDLHLFTGRAGRLDPQIALGSVLAHIVLAIVIVAVQVRRAHGSGVGGAS